MQTPPSLEHRTDLTQKMELRTVLIVDDERVVRELCADTLDDYRVLQASSAEEALKLIEAEPIDAVLTDVLMAGMDGIELLKRIKTIDPEIAVIVMTGINDRETVLRALQCGADDYLDKPIKLLELSTRLNQLLERKQMAEQLRRLKRLDQVHNQFLGLVSHKLKTPVTAISLILQHLALDSDTAEGQALQMALSEASHMNDLIEDLLYFSENLMDPPPINPQPIEPQKLMKQVICYLQEFTLKHRVQVVFNPPDSLPPTCVDQERARFALKSVLENAIKFSPAGANVSVEALADESFVELRIRDHGPGIDDDEISKIFDRFYQIDPTQTGQIRGFGLGLFYAREFIHRENGTLELLSCPGEGTTARVRFPICGC